MQPKSEHPMSAPNYRQPVHIFLVPLDQSARIIANALGTMGTCHEYVALLAQALDDYGLDDPETQELHRLVQKYLAELS